MLVEVINIGVFKLHQPNESTPFDAQKKAKPAYYGLLDALKQE